MLSIIFFFLLAGSIAAVIGILWRILGNQKHLDETKIRRFLFNQMSDDERRKVISHLGICEDCQELLTNFDKPRPIEDHLVDDKNE